MGFKEYLHVENLNNIEVEGILDGFCYIFPKLDGTNGSVWSDNGVTKAGSRRRELSLTQDNAGFYKWVIHNESISAFFAKYGNRYRLFGEWLVPHHLKTYRDNAWRLFYIFDVYDGYKHEYLSYAEYTELDFFGLCVIPYLSLVCQPAPKALEELLDKNSYLITVGAGAGEGIVIKNHSYLNKYGRFTYAKIVREECKQRQGKPKQKNKINKGKIEQIIVDICVTDVLVSKTYAKIVTETGGWSGKNIPYLLSLVFRDVVKEETWNIIKKYKNPTINFKILQKLCNNKIKELKPELF